MRGAVPLTEKVPPQKPLPGRDVLVPQSASNKVTPSNVFPFPIGHCLALIDVPLRAVPELVSTAVTGSNWHPDYALSKKYAIAIELPTAVFFFLKLKQRQFVESDLKKISKLIASNPKDVYCGDWKRENGSDSIAIIKLENRDSRWNPRAYQFVTARSKPTNKQDRWHHIALLAGDTLVLQEKKLTKNTAEELQRTIIHEGMHLYGQPWMVSNEPTVMGGKVSPRNYLEQLDSTEGSYRDSVTQEICIDAQIMKLVQAGNIDSKERVNQKLKEVFEIMLERQQKFNTSNAEAYWYFVEGIPQYLDQNFIFQKNPQKIIDLYNSYCARSEGIQSGFYANYGGAAIIHGLEFVFGSTGAWRSGLGLDRGSTDGWLVEISEMLDNHSRLH